MSEFTSELIGDVDAGAADFKTLLNHLQDTGVSLPPSQVPSLAQIPAMFGALVAWLEHGDAVITAGAKSALHTAAVLGRQDVSQVEATVASGLKSRLDQLLAEAAADGVDLSNHPALAQATQAPPTDAPAPAPADLPPTPFLDAATPAQATQAPPA